MSYQFIHIQTYGDSVRSVGQNENHVNSARQVFGEAMRLPEYSRHVDNPLPAHCVGGTHTVEELARRRRERLLSIREKVVSKTGKTYERRLRKDAQTLYTEIHSHPMKCSVLLENYAQNRHVINQWLALLLRDFENRMPSGIEWSAVLHRDEEYVHAHILAINADQPKLNAASLHCGKTAASRYRAAHDTSSAIPPLPKPELLLRPRKPRKPKLARKQQTRVRNQRKYEAAIFEWEQACTQVHQENQKRLRLWRAESSAHLREARKLRTHVPEMKAYDDAMRALQDHYHDAVGKPCGLLRDGPRKERLSTVEHATRKRQAEKLAKDIKNVKHMRRETAAEAQNIADQTKTFVKNLEAREARLLLREEEIQRREKDLTARVSAFDELEVAMEETLSAAERGEIHFSARGFQLSNPNITEKLKNFLNPDLRQTPARKIFEKFLKLIKRTVVGSTGHPPVSTDEIPAEDLDRPGL
ncbi:Mob protein [Martelella radicis]|uniref:Plasmid recombination enzyme n=1 Tax=Martelella radicis TaxID=1397476 RepID=A0A7W6KNF0_9HYPH|nr:Mob protein [Martelella radicis]MBB4124428.1 hypothetical protein [Martelella radicis]